ILPAHPDRPGLCVNQAVDHSQESRFAGAGGAEQYTETAGGDGHRKLIDDDAFAVALRHPVDFNHGAKRWRNAVETICNTRSTARGRKIAGNAPSSTRSTAYWPSPSKTRVPSPPAPIRAATTVNPIAWTVTMRSPARRTGRASGSSSCQKIS